MQIKTGKYRSLMILFIAILSLLFFIGGPGSHSPRSFKTIWNLGHIIYFALLPLLIFSFTPNKIKIKPTIQAFIVISITLILGIIVELFQYGLDRTPDIGDISRNMIGALIAIFFFLPIGKSIPKPVLFSIKIIIFVLVAAQFSPIVIALIDEHHARRDFPVLSDFQTPFQLYRWGKNTGISIDYIHDNPGNIALKVELTTNRYSGVFLKYFPANWEPYKHLQYRIFNPVNEPLTLKCRIHDQKHTKGSRQYQDRFTRTYTITQGWHTITISLKEVQQAPATREMNLTRIHSFGIYVTRLPYPRIIYIDDLILF